MVTKAEAHAYYLGWAEALLFAQAYNDEEGGKQTLITHLPGKHGELVDEFDPKRLTAMIDHLDEEGGVTVYRLGKGKWGTTTIEIGGSEGHFGLPEWED